MNIQTISMDPRIARIHYLDYRKKVVEHRKQRRLELERQAHEAGKALGQIRIAKTRLEKEDEELMRAYRSMALGQRILNLPRVMREAGVDAKFLPKLAIARADWKDCYFHVEHGLRTYFSSQRWLPYSSRGAKPHTIEMPRDTFPAETTNTNWRTSSDNAYRKLPGYPLKALVPSVPAHLRPNGDLSDYHILWEPVWEPAAPADPLLLKKVGDTTYVILAQWDLTPLEQMILEGRIGT